MNEQQKKTLKQLALSKSFKKLEEFVESLEGPPLGLQVKLGSIAVHADEMLSPHRHQFDISAMETLIQDADVKAWVEKMSKDGFLPVKRNK